MSPNNQSSKNEFDLGLTRHWIAKCLVMGRKIEYIRRSLLEKGLPISVVDAEIKLAQESPYIKGGRTVYARDIKTRATANETTQTGKTEKKITADPRSKQSICSPLENGDYLPLFIANGKNRRLEIHTKACSEFILILLPSCTTSIQVTKIWSIAKQNSPCFLIAEKDSTLEPGLDIYHEESLRNLFKTESPNTFLIIKVQKNLKIDAIHELGDKSNLFENTLHQIKASLCSPATSNLIRPPVLIVPNAITKDLCDRLIEHAQANESQGTTANRKNKSRFHVAPSKSLIKELDNKLCRSLLPEIEKTYYSQITHRETYKTCYYDAEDLGQFASHRDTIEPYLHRRFGFSLALNNEYSGGGINFPEYNDDIINIDTGSAIIFPGTLFHQVKTIEKGIRWVLISFLFTEKEARPCKDETNLFNFKANTDRLILTQLRPQEGQSPNE